MPQNGPSRAERRCSGRYLAETPGPIRPIWIKNGRAASYLIGRGQVAKEGNRHRSGHVNRASGSCPVRRQWQSLRTAARRALRIGVETSERAVSQPALYLIAVE